MRHPFRAQQDPDIPAAAAAARARELPRATAIFLEPGNAPLFGAPRRGY